MGWAVTLANLKAAVVDHIIESDADNCTRRGSAVAMSVYCHGRMLTNILQVARGVALTSMEYLQVVIRDIRIRQRIFHARVLDPQESFLCFDSSNHFSKTLHVLLKELHVVLFALTVFTMYISKWEVPEDKLLLMASKSVFEWPSGEKKGKYIDTHICAFRTCALLCCFFSNSGSSIPSCPFSIVTTLVLNE